MSDTRASHVPPPRYKSTARPWCDIPGRCGFYVGSPPKKSPCCRPATHRCKTQQSDGSVKRYGWLCKEHASVVQYSTKISSADNELLSAGRTCDVWKCERKATKWTADGYAICNNCSGN